MSPYVGKLHDLARKDSRRILGLMSGTSLDGLDIALCRVSGWGMNTRLTLERFKTVPYPREVKEEIRKVFSKPVADLQLLCVLNPFIGRLHATLVLETLSEWETGASEIDLIASHGQTVFHAPRSKHHWQQYPDATLQIGDGDHIAVQTGIITLSDFRQKHLAAGGEGAPLAVYGDVLLFRNPSENRILLNLGGIANFTYLPKNQEAGEVFTTDTGPANTLLDACCQKYFDRPFDPDGAIAESGTKSDPLLFGLLKEPFFRLPFPKSTGPELFNLDFLHQVQKKTGTLALSPEDVMATLAHFTAHTVSDAILRSLPPGGNNTVYVSGGGAENSFLCGLIGGKLSPNPLKALSALGVPGDAKEAVLFALLANEAIASPYPDQFKGGENLPAVGLGKISFPG